MSARQDPPYPDDRPRPPYRGGGDEGFSSLIPYRNPKSLVAYYCGVFSLIPVLGFVLAPIALIFGILGVGYARQNPTAKGMGHSITGIVLGAISLLGHLFVLVLIFLGTRRP
jgi:hypothetical protein